MTSETDAAGAARMGRLAPSAGRLRTSNPAVR